MAFEGREWPAAIEGWEFEPVTGNAVYHADFSPRHDGVEIFFARAPEAAGGDHWLVRSVTVRERGQVELGEQERWRTRTRNTLRLSRDATFQEAVDRARSHIEGVTDQARTGAADEVEDEDQDEDQEEDQDEAESEQPEPDEDAPEAVATAIRERFQGRVTEQRTCEDVVDVARAAVAVLTERQPSPFDERESGAVEDALDLLADRVDTRLRRLNCGSVSQRRTVPGQIRGLIDAVTTSRPSAEREAERFVAEAPELPLPIRFTYRDVAELISQRSIEGAPSGARRCEAVLEFVDDLARDVPKVRRARELFPEQQAGEADQVQGALLARWEQIEEELRENGCFENDPDFRLEDLEGIYRDMVAAVGDPDMDLSTHIGHVTRLARDIRTPPPERIGTQRVVPTEETRRRSQTAVPITQERIEIVIDEAVERSHLHFPHVLTSEEGGIEVRGTGIVDNPTDEVREQVRQLFAGVVREDLIEPGVQIGVYHINEDGDALHSILINNGVPVSPDALNELRSEAD